MCGSYLQQWEEAGTTENKKQKFESQKRFKVLLTGRGVAAGRSERGEGSAEKEKNEEGLCVEKEGANNNERYSLLEQKHEVS